MTKLKKSGLCQQDRLQEYEERLFRCSFLLQQKWMYIHTQGQEMSRTTTSWIIVCPPPVPFPVRVPVSPPRTPRVTFCLPAYTLSLDMIVFLCLLRNLRNNHPFVIPKNKKGIVVVRFLLRLKKQVGVPPLCPFQVRFTKRRHGLRSTQCNLSTPVHTV